MKLGGKECKCCHCAGEVGEGGRHERHCTVYTDMHIARGGQRIGCKGSGRERERLTKGGYHNRNCTTQTK